MMMNFPTTHIPLDNYREFCMYLWIRDESLSSLKLKKCIHLLKHEKKLSDSFKTQIGNFIFETCNVMLNEEYSFTRMANIYRVLESEWIDYSRLKFYSDICILDLINDIECVKPSRGCTKPYIYMVVCD